MSERINMSQNRENPAALMRDFIKDRGGEVGFDDFSREHLVGSGVGFYSDRIDLSQLHGPVPTPMHSSPEYRSAYAQMVLVMGKQYAEATGREYLRLVEFGPGGGELCDELQKQIQRTPERYSPLKELIYTGIDPSQSHVDALKRQGVAAQLGTIQKSGLADGSADIVVAEEVLDSMPYRLYEWDRTQQKITGEAFVVLENDTLRLRFKTARADQSTEEVQAHLAKGRFSDPYYAYSPEYLDAWREVYRVLASPGIALVSDYTIGDSFDFLMIPAGEEEVVKNPYTIDLTHFIDEDLQIDLAAELFQHVKQVDAVGLFLDFAGPAAVAQGGHRMFLAAVRGDANRSNSDSASQPSVDREALKERLMALDNRTRGCQTVLRLIYNHEKASEITTVLEANQLSGGALWALYTDKANDDIGEFVNLVLSKDQNAFDYARRYS